MNRIVYMLLVVTSISCSQHETEKYQSKRDNIINVRERVNEIKIENVLINSWSELLVIGDYLLIEDYKSTDNLLHLFKKSSFTYVTSLAPRGQGPGEFSNIGRIGIDEVNQMFYVTDHGKQSIFSFNLDSVLSNPHYKPEVKMKLSEKQYPGRYQYINDTLCMGFIIEPIKNNSFQQITAKWNMNTGEIVPMKYKHPDIERKRIRFAISTEYDIYIECYSHHDLMSICSINGDLKFNIYGPNYNNRTSNEYYHFDKVEFCGNRIVAAYSGGHNFSEEERYPTKFLVFAINGDYIKTLETGYRMTDFCYDIDNNRIIMHLNDEIQFAYLNLDKLI